MGKVKLWKKLGALEALSIIDLVSLKEDFLSDSFHCPLSYTQPLCHAKTGLRIIVKELSHRCTWMSGMALVC